MADLSTWLWIHSLSFSSLPYSKQNMVVDVGDILSASLSVHRSYEWLENNGIVRSRVFLLEPKVKPSIL